MIDAIVTGDNVAAQDAFNSAISNKVGDALEIKRKEISKDIVSTVKVKKINIKNVSRDLQGNYNKQNILISYICCKILNIQDSIFLESIIFLNVLLPT